MIVPATPRKLAASAEVAAASALPATCAVLSPKNRSASRSGPFGEGAFGDGEGAFAEGEGEVGGMGSGLCWGSMDRCRRRCRTPPV
jgi:hypothetical protein